jgi:hypothetical protein
MSEHPEEYTTSESIDPDDFSGIPDAELDDDDQAEVEAMLDAYYPEEWWAMRGTLTREEREASERDTP